MCWRCYPSSRCSSGSPEPLGGERKPLLWALTRKQQTPASCWSPSISSSAVEHWSHSLTGQRPEHTSAPCKMFLTINNRWNSSTDLLSCTVLPLFVTPDDAVSQLLQIFLRETNTWHVLDPFFDHWSAAAVLVLLIYLLVAYGVSPLVVIKLPGLELLHGFINSNVPNFDSLLKRYELSLSRCLHHSIRVVHRRRWVCCRLNWRVGNLIQKQGLTNRI